MKKLMVLAALLLIVSPAFAQTASKDGTPAIYIAGDQGPTSPVRADYEYSTCGSMDCVPTTGGSHDGWAEYFITTVYNNTGQSLHLVELGFPCCGPPTDIYGWVVWTNVGGMVPPFGPANTADFFGEFTPVDPAPDTFPPTVYTYIDISAAGVVIAPGAYWCFGYDVTGNGGQVDYNGTDTYGWYGGTWDPDAGWGRTAVLQVKANFSGGNPTEESSWGAVKALYR